MKQEQHIFLADRVEFMIQYHFTWEAKNRGQWLLNNQHVIKCVCFFFCFPGASPKWLPTFFWVWTFYYQYSSRIASKQIMTLGEITSSQNRFVGYARGNSHGHVDFRKMLEGSFPRKVNFKTLPTRNPIVRLCNMQR